MVICAAKQDERRCWLLSCRVPRARSVQMSSAIACMSLSDKYRVRRVVVVWHIICVRCWHKLGRNEYVERQINNQWRIQKFWKWGWGRNTMYQPRRHLSQMHIMNYTRFVLLFATMCCCARWTRTWIVGTTKLFFKWKSLYGKRRLAEKNAKANGGRGGRPPSPPPPIWIRHPRSSVLLKTEAAKNETFVMQ